MECMLYLIKSKSILFKLMYFYRLHCWSNSLFTLNMKSSGGDRYKNQTLIGLWIYANNLNKFNCKHVLVRTVSLIMPCQVTVCLPSVLHDEYRKYNNSCTTVHNGANELLLLLIRHVFKLQSLIKSAVWPAPAHILTWILPTKFRPY